MTTNDYSKKIKKMEDMILQANFLKKELANINPNKDLIAFINNSLIYYSTRLKYRDFKKSKTIKSKIRNFLIKNNAYLFYNYIKR